MRPLAILTGFILGTSGSITLSLAVVGLIFWVLAPKYPQLQAEVQPLLVASVLFLSLTTASGLGFMGLIRDRWWRWPAQIAMWLLLAAIVVYYLP